MKHLSSFVMIEEKAEALCLSPRAAFEGQSFLELEKSLEVEGCEISNAMCLRKKQRLYLCTIQNGIFFVGCGLDGAIITEDFSAVDHTTMFNKHPGLGINEKTAVDIEINAQFDEMFVGFDFFWGNYYHFLSFALAKSYIAKAFLGGSLPIAFPDVDRQNEHWAAYSNTVRDQALQFSSLAENTQLLPRGAYRVRKLHFLAIDPPHSWAITFADGFTSVFDAMAQHARRSDSVGENVYITRGNKVGARTTAKTNTTMGMAAARHSFIEASFENMDLRQQISTAIFARKFVSPHGAGLTNTLFHPGGLKVLEINKKLDGPNNGYRVPFYMAAVTRGHEYYMLDGVELDDSQWMAESAFQAMDNRNFSPDRQSTWSVDAISWRQAIVAGVDDSMDWAIDLTAHISQVGDFITRSREINGTGASPLVCGVRGDEKGRHIEGFQIDPLNDLPVKIEYKAVFSDGSETKWVSSGNFVGTRGQGKPLYGFAVRIFGPSAELFSCRYAGSFSGDVITADHAKIVQSSGGPLEAMQIYISPIARQDE